jgi:exo-1,4-beta-D-glucosaminidase
VSDNFYWLSAKEDTLDWKHRRDTVYTPQAEFGDLSGLESLPETAVAAATTFALGSVTTTITNAGKGVAFMVHLRVVDAKGEDVVPVFWNDNYVTLLPGEHRTLTAKFSAGGGQGLKVICDGWNVKAELAGKPVAKTPEKK